MINRKPILFVAFITAVCLIADSMLYIFMPLYPERFGLDSMWQVGVLLAVNRFIRLPLSPAIGWLYHTIGKRNGIVIAAALAILTSLSYAFIDGFLLLFIVRCLWGISWGILRLGGFLTVIDCSSFDKKGQAMGLYNGLWSLGGLLGMLTGGLVPASHFETAIVIVTVLMVMLLIPAVYYIPSDNAAAPAADEPQDKGRLPIWTILMQAGPIRMCVTGFIVAAVFFGVFASTISKAMAEQLPSGLTLPGIILTAAAVAGILQAFRWGVSPLLSPLFGRLSDGKKGRLPWFLFGLAGSGLILALLPAASAAVWLIMLFVLQLTNTLLTTVMDALASDTAEREQPAAKITVMTAYTLALDLGSAVGPVVGFALVDLLSVTTMFSWCGILLLATALLWINARSGSPLRRRMSQ
ncbi:MFS transporter [Paenibacillus turpanensis]|uniref:MFS transporter n=1 Tax=Paenibacillus turpanensis TaxID=2689078 RepID=UPI00140E4C2B|nr:MFS transporter [Paenibacillus turpanensis]